jgi:hypothetical protein
VGLKLVPIDRGPRQSGPTTAELLAECRRLLDNWRGSVPSRCGGENVVAVRV